MPYHRKEREGAEETIEVDHRSWGKEESNRSRDKESDQVENGRKEANQSKED